MFRWFKYVENKKERKKPKSNQTEPNKQFELLLVHTFQNRFRALKINKFVCVCVDFFLLLCYLIALNGKLGDRNIYNTNGYENQSCEIVLLRSQLIWTAFIKENLFQIALVSIGLNVIIS